MFFISPPTVAVERCQTQFFHLLRLSAYFDKLKGSPRYNWTLINCHALLWIPLPPVQSSTQCEIQNKTYSLFEVILRPCSVSPEHPLRLFPWSSMSQRPLKFLSTASVIHPTIWSLNKSRNKVSVYDPLPHRVGGDCAPESIQHMQSVERWEESSPSWGRVQSHTYVWLTKPLSQVCSRNYSLSLHWSYWIIKMPLGRGDLWRPPSSGLLLGYRVEKASCTGPHQLIAEHLQGHRSSAFPGSYCPS